jgi:hypothetical protein
MEVKGPLIPTFSPSEGEKEKSFATEFESLFGDANLPKVLLPLPFQKRERGSRKGIFNYFVTAAKPRLRK